LAIIYGNHIKPVHYWTSIATDKPMLHAYADKLYYNHLKQAIKLAGHATVIQGDHILHAPIINYDIRTQHVHTEAAANTRTTIVLHPKNLSSQSTMLAKIR